jgi:shikimate dehydrogenase
MSSLDDAVDGAAIVVNATAIGLTDDQQPVGVERMPSDAAIIDLVYRRDETAWVRAARARGHRAIDGLPMLIEQGALAFQRWFGIAPDRDVMWRSVGRPRVD